MKTLYLLRHAEAASGSPTGRDHDRPLTERGETQAHETADYLLSQGRLPQLILCSDARRTQQTLEAVTDSFGMTDTLTVSPELYLASAERLLEEIGTADDSFDSVMVVAHNPGLSELAFQLSHDEKTADFSPAMLAVFNCDIENWGEISSSNTRLADLFTPKA